MLIYDKSVTLIKTFSIESEANTGVIGVNSMKDLIYGN